MRFGSATNVRTRAAGVLAMVLIAACGGDGGVSEPEPDPDPVPTILDIVPDEVSFSAVGDTATVYAQLRDQYGQAMEISGAEWSSDDPAVATAGGGVVASVAEGATQIRVTAEGLEATAQVVVAQVAAEIRLEPDSVRLTAIGDTARFTASLADANGNELADPPTVVWSSSDSTVLVPDPDGLGVAVGNGASEITATAGDVATAAHVVVAQVADVLSLDPDSVAFNALGDSALLGLDVTDRRGTPIDARAVSWSVSDPTIASVEGLTLRPLATGAATITVHAADLSDSLQVTVTQVPASLLIDSADIVITALRDTADPGVRLLDSTAVPIADAEMSLTSRNPDVAWPTADRRIYGYTLGETVVDVAAGSFTDSLRVQVTQVAVDLVAEDTMTLTANGQTRAWYVWGRDANGFTMKGVLPEFRSLDPDIATVEGQLSTYGDPQGLVTAVYPGTARIEASLDGLADTLEAKVTYLRAPAEIRFRIDGDTTLYAATDTVRPDLTYPWPNLWVEAVLTDSGGQPITDADYTYNSMNHTALRIAERDSSRARVEVRDYGVNALQLYANGVEKQLLFDPVRVPCKLAGGFSKVYSSTDRYGVLIRSTFNPNCDGESRLGEYGHIGFNSDPPTDRFMLDPSSLPAAYLYVISMDGMDPAMSVRQFQEDYYGYTLSDPRQANRVSSSTTDPDLAAAEWLQLDGTPYIEDGDDNVLEIRSDVGAGGEYMVYAGPGVMCAGGWTHLPIGEWRSGSGAYPRCLAFRLDEAAEISISGTGGSPEAFPDIQVVTPAGYELTNLGWGSYVFDVPRGYYVIRLLESGSVRVNY